MNLRRKRNHTNANERVREPSERHHVGVTLTDQTLVS
jgi:hypothetical protein